MYVCLSLSLTLCFLVPGAKQRRLIYLSSIYLAILGIYVRIYRNICRYIYKSCVVPGAKQRRPPCRMRSAVLWQKETYAQYLYLSIYLSSIYVSIVGIYVCMSPPLSPYPSLS